jgi:hypothetical protein
MSRIREIADARDWTESTLVELLLDVIAASGMEDAVVAALEAVADEEAAWMSDLPGEEDA